MPTGNRSRWSVETGAPWCGWNRGNTSAFPDAALLDALRARLAEPPECLPQCAALARAQVRAGDQELGLELELHLAAPAAVAVPDSPPVWTPAWITVDGEPGSLALRDAEGRLRLPLPAGVHTVRLEGPLPASAAQVQIDWPLVPGRLKVHTPGWTVSGVDAQGVPESTLALLREREGSPQAELQPRPLPGFARLERTLRLADTWTVHYRLTRLGPRDRPLALRIPLLSGESLLTQGLEARHGAVVARLPAGRDALGWETRLAQTLRLELQAPPSLPAGKAGWFEVWRLEAAPLWHVEVAGLGPVHRLDPRGRWRPEWRPWPGERLRLQISRPPGTGPHPHAGPHGPDP